MERRFSAQTIASDWELHFTPQENIYVNDHIVHL